MNKRDWLRLAVCIGVPLAIAGVGGWITAINIEPWYRALSKPPSTPPDWAFGPVWTTLYVLMGVAVFLVWRRGWSGADVKLAVGVYVLQLALNALWTPVFFGLHSIVGGLAVIVVLWVTILATILRFWRVSRIAAALLAPYLLWVSYATHLNFSIWRLNA